MGAKDDKKTPQGEEDDRQGNEDKNDKKKEINEMEEPEVDDDQIDPHHGKLLSIIKYLSHIVYHN